MSYLSIMADADSLHEANSDLEHDSSAVDADVEDDESVAQRFLASEYKDFV